MHSIHMTISNNLQKRYQLCHQLPWKNCLSKALIQAKNATIYTYTAWPMGSGKFYLVSCHHHQHKHSEQIPVRLPRWKNKQGSTIFQKEDMQYQLKGWEERWSTRRMLNSPPKILGYLKDISEAAKIWRIPQFWSFVHRVWPLLLHFCAIQVLDFGLHPLLVSTSILMS